MNPLDNIEKFKDLSRYHETVWAAGQYAQKWVPIIPAGCVITVPGWSEGVTEHMTQPAMYTVKPVSTLVNGETLRALFYSPLTGHFTEVIDGGEPETSLYGTTLHKSQLVPKQYERASYEAYQRFVVDIVSGVFEEALMEAQKDFAPIDENYDAVLAKAVVTLKEEAET